MFVHVDVTICFCWLKKFFYTIPVFHIIKKKGSWKNKFDERNTINGTFHALKPSSNDIIKREAMMMKSTRVTYFGTNIKPLGGAHCALLEYGIEDEEERENEDYNQDFAALFFLPKENNQSCMESMISNLTSFMGASTSSTGNKKRNESTIKPLHHLIENELTKTKVALTIPRFKISYGIKQLKSELQQLGIKEAFNRSGKHMFNEMTHDPLVYLDEVYHKAVMEVNEEGTVAAAATVGVMMTRSLPKPPPELVFDRPFVMVVVHLETGLPLFMGKVDDPEF